MSIVIRFRFRYFVFFDPCHENKKNTIFHDV